MNNKEAVIGRVQRPGCSSSLKIAVRAEAVKRKVGSGLTPSPETLAPGYSEICKEKQDRKCVYACMCMCK